MSPLAFHCIADFREGARRALPRMVFDFIDGASGSETTLRQNREALDRVRLIGRAPVDVAARSTATELFGDPVAAPIIIGPTGLAGVAWPRADVELAKAAARAGVPFVLSTAATASMEEVARASTGRRWFQLYLLKDRAMTERLVDRAAHNGFELIEVTVDTAVPGSRLRDSRNGFSLPLRWTPRKVIDVLSRPKWLVRTARAGIPRLEIMAAEIGGALPGATIAEVMRTQIDPTVTWDDLAWMRDRWRGKLVVKGLIDPIDVEAAVRAGMDGVVISNHGGRQLDGALPTIDALDDAVAAARGRLAVLADSGFRTGSDIARALALGAKAVQLGRATLFAAAVAGEAGVFRALELLKAELDVVMGLVGAKTVVEIDRTRVRRDGEGAVLGRGGGWHGTQPVLEDACLQAST